MGKAVVLNKKFLLEALNQEDENKLKDFQPKKPYRVLDKLEISITNILQYFDGFGSITPIGLDTSLKTFIPITIYGLTDYFSSYFASQNFILKISPSWIGTLNVNGIYGFNFPITLTNPPQNGAFVRYLQKSVGGNTYFCRSILSTSNQIGYGTILNNLSDSVYLIDKLMIRVDNANINQFDNPLILSRLKINGKIETDSINLKTYVKPSDFNTSIVTLPLSIVLDKNLIINQAINYDCVNINYIFSLIKIK